MLETIIVVILILWILGFLGPMVLTGLPHTGSGIHLLIIIVIVLVLVRLLRGGI